MLHIPDLPKKHKAPISNRAERRAEKRWAKGAEARERKFKLSVALDNGKKLKRQALLNRHEKAHLAAVKRREEVKLKAK